MTLGLCPEGASLERVKLDTVHFGLPVHLLSCSLEFLLTQQPIISDKVDSQLKPSRDLGEALQDRGR